MQTKYKPVLSTLIPMRWGDMDAYGHINNTLFFRYMEQARCEWLEREGITVAKKGIAPVIINASCTFLAQLNYPGTVSVRMFIGAPGRSSLPSYYEIRIDGEDKLYATGESKIVWMDAETGKSAPIPDALRMKLAQL